MSDDKVHIPGWLLSVVGGLILAVVSVSGTAIYWAGQMSAQTDSHDQQIRQLQERLDRMDRARDWERRREAAK